MILNNTSGRNYIVLESAGDYALLAQTNFEQEIEFVIAYDLRISGPTSASGEDKDQTCTWAQGKYFFDLSNALNCYKEKVKEMEALI